MKITKRQLKKIIAESFSIPAHRRGFMGPGFGSEPNHYNPYNLTEEEEMPEPIEDAWAGGENLVDPVDIVKATTGLEGSVEQERIDHSISERRLKNFIKRILVEIER